MEAAAIASYPMYRGIADLWEWPFARPDTIEGLFNTYIEYNNKYDFSSYT